VCVVAVPDRPAGLSEVLAVISDAGIDIEYMYSILSHGDEKAYMVFRASDEEKLVETFKAKGIAIAAKADLGLK